MASQVKKDLQMCHGKFISVKFLLIFAALWWSYCSFEPFIDLGTVAYLGARPGSSFCFLASKDCLCEVKACVTLYLGITVTPESRLKSGSEGSAHLLLHLLVLLHANC